MSVRSLACLVAILLALATGAASAETRETSSIDPMFTPDTVRAAIDDAVEYLLGSCEDNGKFLYRINLDPDIKQEPKYNLLRHAGAIYAMTQAQKRAGDPEIVATMKRAAEFLKVQALGPVPDEEGLLAVWSRDEINHAGAPDLAKLGGTGISLVALLSLEQLAPGTTELEQLRAMGRFLLFMQKEDGSFVSKYWAERGKDDTWVSNYYPGEAALGLVMLYERDPSPQWLDAAARVLSFLARERKGKVELPADHWALLATERLLAAAPGEVVYDRELILGHARDVVESILRSQPAPLAQYLLGSHVKDGRTTPTATRLEGLLAALAFLPDSERTLRRRVLRTIETGIAFLLLAQIDDGEHRGAMPRAIRPLPEDPRTVHFNARAREVRIDYVQHALSAYIGYERIALGGAPPPPQDAAGTEQKKGP